MYIAPPDRAFGDDEWRSFIADHPFGLLIAAGRHRDLPETTPTQFLLDGNEIVLHVVARNTVLDAIAEQPSVKLCVSGDWAYIPSTWKALDGEDPDLGIPTTYYAAVELSGTATVIEQPDDLGELLRRQLRLTQPGVPIVDPARAHRPKLAGIRGIRIDINQVQAKFKYGGTVNREHRLRVAGLLENRDDPGDRVAAAHVRRRDRRSDTGAPT